MPERHRWPGNVRELENVIERAVVLAESDRVTLAESPTEITQAGHLPIQVLESKSAARRLAAAISNGPHPDDFSSRAFDSDDTPAWDARASDALRKCGGNKAKAARLMGLPRSTYFSKLKKHGFMNGSEPISNQPVSSQRRETRNSALR